MNNPSIIKRVSARAVSVPGDDIDTDRIIPARFMRCVTFDGLGQYAFHDVRFEADGTPKSHPMNDRERAGAGVLVAGRNFGCGSSREHAPQSLAKWGIVALVAESFADIFAGNCASIGIPAVTVQPADLARLRAAVEADASAAVTVDLEALAVRFEGRLEAFSAPAALPEARRRNFLAGTWDTVGSLLANGEAAAATAARLPYVSGF